MFKNLLQNIAQGGRVDKELIKIPWLNLSMGMFFTSLRVSMVII